ncbi:MAG TPA: hypothetical protein VN739_02145 [Nitrososphaerales archaeon]|nr:hypothetical protein [Nitrososphaerales archaeon]
MIGQLTSEGIVDLSIIRNALQYRKTVDWDVFAPLSKHSMERQKLTVNSWGNFEWLAEETRRHLVRREAGK